MRTLTFVKPGALEWREVLDPLLRGDREALVRPIAASTCDLDQLIISGAPRLLELIGDGAISPERVASELLDWETAPEALVDPSFKPVFVREH